MSKPFKDKVVLVTGAASGIGRATALRLSTLGASLSLCDINSESLASVASTCAQHTSPTHVFHSTVDVSSPDQVSAFITSTLSHFASLSLSHSLSEEGERAKGEQTHINHVFNCAGLNPTSLPLEATPTDYYDRLLAVNLTGLFNVTRACIPHMAPPHASSSSSFVNTSSVSALRPPAQQAVYAATKLAIIGFSKSMALELGPRGIRTNVVAPGYIDTPTNAGIVKGGSAVERMEKGNALGRLGDAGEVADVVVFLMGEGSRYVNGGVVEVDGGIRGTVVLQEGGGERVMAG